MELKFLNWNINKVGKGNPQLVSGILTKENPDVLLMVECDLKDAFFDTLGYKRVEGRSKMLKFYVLDKYNKNIKTHDFGKRAVHVGFTVNNRKTLISGVHYGDKMNNNDHVQYTSAQKYKTDFETYKRSFKCSSHVIFGDFNMNPFDKGLACKDSFHAKPTYSKRNKLPYYYNPSWRLFGDYKYISNDKKPPGTYKFQSYKSGDHLWNVLDGVIISSDLAEKGALIDDSLRILDDATIYKKQQIQFSDHLPITFKIKL